MSVHGNEIPRFENFLRTFHDYKKAMIEYVIYLRLKAEEARKQGKLALARKLERRRQQYLRRLEEL